MDSVIAAWSAVADGDLMLCPEVGVAYQADQSNLVAYDAAYYEKCAGYDPEIERRITQARVALVARHYSGRMLDVGIGSGAFVKARERTFGFDVNPVAIEWLKRNDLWSERFDEFGALSFWDVLEHCSDPSIYLRRVMLQGYVFASLPIFSSLADIRQSKHYRPNEHLYYFTRDGFIHWMNARGFLLMEMNGAETTAGRESIASFAFKRKWLCRDQ